MTRRTLLWAVLLVVLLLVLSGCAAGSENFSADDPAGFIAGFWHGLIAPIALIIRIFNRDVLIYEIDNIGIWYGVGYVLAITSYGGGGAAARGR